MILNILQTKYYLDFKVGFKYCGGGNFNPHIDLPPGFARVAIVADNNLINLLRSTVLRVVHLNYYTEEINSLSFLGK